MSPWRRSRDALDRERDGPRDPVDRLLVLRDHVEFCVGELGEVLALPVALVPRRVDRIEPALETVARRAR